MKLSNKAYDILMWVFLALPALILFYAGLGDIWNWPKTTEVSASLGLLATFLGSLLKLSNAKFKQSHEIVSKDYTP